ncbi:MAG TPA: VIT family protein [Rhizomicrobium sp.]|nr:VIT family protein [Rhizomicrobium sp.]
MRRTHRERHRVERIGWLRAAVLGANDGIISTASLILGVTAASATKGAILLAGGAGLVAGAMSMAAGEFVSVSSQADAERSDLARETRELKADPRAEREELANIYVQRGLDHELAQRVASELMSKDALAAHARDELGISDITTARPVQAAITSAITFSTGAALPLIAVWIAPMGNVAPVVAICSLAFLAALGVVGAKAGGAEILKPTIRVTFWGAIAMGVTAGVGLLIGKAV